MSCDELWLWLVDASLGCMVFIVESCQRYMFMLVLV